MKTIDSSLNLKIKENDEKIKALFTQVIPKKSINNNYKTNSSYNISNQFSKYTKLQNGRSAIQNQYKKLRLLQKTLTTRDLTNFGTNRNNAFFSMTTLNTINSYKKSPLKIKPKLKLKQKITRTDKKAPLKKVNNHLIATAKKNKRKNFIDTTYQIKKPNHKVNLTEMFDRFELDQIKKNEKIEKMKKIKEEKELSMCSHRPILNKKTEDIMKEDKTDFFTRQELLEDRKKEREEKLKETLLQNEHEKIMKSSYIYQKQLGKSLSKNGMNTSTLSDLSSVTRSQKEVNEGINRLYEWDERRKNKIEQLITEKSLSELIGHVPEIDKRSASMAANKNKEIKFYERLSKEDTLIRAKKALLEKVLTPSFKPNLYLTKNYGKGVKEEKTEINSPTKKNKYDTSTNFANSERKIKKERKERKKKDFDDSSKILVNKILLSDARKRLSISNLNIKRSEFQRVMRSVVIKNMEKKAKPLRKNTRGSSFNI